MIFLKLYDQFWLISDIKFLSIWPFYKKWKHVLKKLSLFFYWKKSHFVFHQHQNHALHDGTVSQYLFLVVLIFPQSLGASSLNRWVFNKCQEKPKISILFTYTHLKKKLFKKLYGPFLSIPVVEIAGRHWIQFNWKRFLSEGKF